MAFQSLTGWSSTQKHVTAASFIGWTLDALDFFLVLFVLKDIAAEFHATIVSVTYGVTLTLVARPVGAFIFGRLADHYGRRPIFMLNIAVYSLLSFSTAFVPSLAMFLVVRTLFGIGMGGIWGVGSSLTMETIKPESRGLISGLLQSGYPMGYLLASLVFALLYVHVGWRGMFMVGIIPAIVLIPYIYAKVPESQAHSGAPKVSTFDVLRRHTKLTIYAVVLMTAFCFLSHGTQDLYPTFLQKARGLTPGVVGSIAVLYNIAAVLGGLIFGSLSQHFGRRRIMIIAALLSIPMIYLWAFSTSVGMLTLGSFLISFFVTASWSAVPAHLNELAPSGARGTFPGTVYQLGNLFASANLTIQAYIAEQEHSYSIALAAVALCAALAVSLLVMFGPEAHNRSMA